MRNAHSLYLEVLGELGLVGFLLLAGALLTGLAAGVRRALATHGGERMTEAAVVASLLAFVVAAGIDWVWQIAAVSVVGIACLGLAAAGSGVGARVRSGRSIRLATAAVGLALVAAQALPLLSSLRIGDSQAAVLRGDTKAAIGDALSARDLEPWASSPYLQLALVTEQAGTSRPRTDGSARRCAATQSTGGSGWSRRGSRPSKAGWRPDAQASPGRRGSILARRSFLPARGGETDGDSLCSDLGVDCCGREGAGREPEQAVNESGASLELSREPALTTDAGPPEGNRLLRFLLISKRARLWRDALRRRMLAGADLLTSLLVCLAIAGLMSVETGVWALVFTPVWLLLAKLFGLYDRDHRALRHLTIDEVPVLFLWALVSTAATVALLKLTPAPGIGFGTAVAVAAIGGVAAALLRGLARWLWRRVTLAERTLILGDGPLAEATRRKLELFPDIHVAVIDQLGLSGSALLSGGQDWSRGVSRVIVASSSVDEELLAELVSHCKQREIKLSVVPPVRGMFGTAVQLNHVADLPVVEYSTWDVSRSTLLLKRALDLAISLPLLVLTAPVIAVLALAIRLDREGPALLRPAARRPGRTPVSHGQVPDDGRQRRRAVVGGRLRR